MASRTIPSDEVEMRGYRADDPEEAERPIPKHNVLDSLVALPEGLRHDLTDDELRKLLFAFDTGIHAFEALRAIPQVPYIREAIADHLSTADHLSAPSSGHPGLAKWAALQAVEKTYKGFLAMNQSKIPKTHEIGTLSKLAAKFGLDPADAKLIADVECDPSVRYGETKVSLEDAVAAHHAALDLSWYVAEEIKGKPVSAP
jgi:HEPN domain-containing protein